MVGYITSHPTAFQRLKWGKNPGKPGGKSVGGYIADLCGLGKAILLCGLCRHKFDPKTYNYVEKAPVPGLNTISDCYGCKAWGFVTMFLKRGT